MAMNIRLEQSLKTVQQLVLSPQMQQAIQILQMPIMELRLKIAEEMAANPLLEEGIEKKESIDEAISIEETSDSSDDTEFKEQFDKLSRLDEEWRNHFKQTNSIRKHTSQDEEKRRFMETSVCASESLHEHLMKQLHLLTLDEDEIKMAEYIIGSIDNNGYLTFDLSQIAETLDAKEEEMERILSKIQKFTPLGVGARNLQECLFLQVNVRQEKNSLVRVIIEKHLTDFAKNKFPKMAKELKVSLQDIKDAQEFITSLEPKPGRVFGTGANSYISPDIFIEEKNGEFEVVLNDDRIPHLHISNLYKKVMNESSSSEDTTKDYIKNKVRSGMWLIKNIQQRQQTIYNIMNQIIKLQINFFKNGIGNLIPMTMQNIASPLNIHESTVSRAISRKYVQTPHGLFPVKYFFSVKMTNTDGSSTSSRNIKQQILNIIENEDPKNPLSDQDIITILKKDGIVLARRTVAKYRGELKIPSSTYRRKY